MGTHEGSTQAVEVALERRAIGLPKAIGTVFGLIAASSALVSVGQGFAACWAEHPPELGEPPRDRVSQDA
jgi:hypothetical protein